MSDSIELPKFLPAFSGKHWGDSEGTPADKDGEIRVRMGKSRFQARRGRDAATGVFSMGYVETKGDGLAPQVGFEPTALRLTADQVVAASHCKHEAYTCKKPIILEFWGTLE